MTNIVKRHGSKEEYDERKVYASVYSAGLNVHLSEKEAEAIADKTCGDINNWIIEKKEVNSKEIFKEVTKSLAKYNKDALSCTKLTWMFPNLCYI